MSKISFIHLSDIHFVKSSNDPADIDKDLRKAILTDLRMNAIRSLDKVSGILVSGDIAFSGNKLEYDAAKEYLSEICEIFNMLPSDVYCVPGNHDVNQKIINDSILISTAQNHIDDKETLDDADKAFRTFIDESNFSSIFKPFSDYNEFAKRFECDISSQNIYWEKYFSLDENLKLRIVGINSSFLSNKDDHQKGKDDRLMYIGQVQIPHYETDVATLLMCHHPPECWKFKDDMLQRINKRADLQLYGHMHSQSVMITEENAILYSGAVHPTRTVDWLPRYNWLTLSSKKVNDESVLKIEIFPRCLKSDRDSFMIDSTCTDGKNCISHEINIDRKRKLSLEDPSISATDESNRDNVSELILENDNKTVMDERQIIYNFYELSWREQIIILTDMCLLSEENNNTTDSKMLSNAIKSAKEHNRLFELHNRIQKQINMEGKI